MSGIFKNILFRVHYANLNSRIIFPFVSFHCSSTDITTMCTEYIVTHILMQK